MSSGVHITYPYVWPALGCLLCVLGALACWWAALHSSGGYYDHDTVQRLQLWTATAVLVLLAVVLLGLEAHRALHWLFHLGDHLDNQQPAQPIPPTP